MNRGRFLGFLVGALASLALAAPASAPAATQTWTLASEFTATPPGANPDHDPYGGTPWSYLAGSTASFAATTTFSRLPTFATGIDGGLSAWSESSTGTPPLVGINPTTSPIKNGNATFPPGQIVVEPGSSNLVAVGWTSPLGQTATVSVSGALSVDAGSCNHATTWTVEENGTPLPGGTGTNAGSFSTSATVAPGATIYVAVSNAGVAACDATGLSLQITANLAVPAVAPASAPAVTIAEPVAGSSTTVSEPTFSGAAGDNSGDSGQVTLRIYAGQAASGVPVQTLTVTRSGAAWSATLTSPLSPGTYTAQAEQDDLMGDVGLSPPVTFTVTAPAITLSVPGPEPLTTPTPILTGTAGTGAGSAPVATIDIFAGATPSGSPLLALVTPIAASGQFSVEVAPALPDGTYTAVASQAQTAGPTRLSAPQTFSVDTHAPVVTFVSPGIGSRADVLQLVFAGTAGSAQFDLPVVLVALYPGSNTSGRRIGTVNAPVTGATWSARWPGSLAPGTYTALAFQTDAAGHVGVSSSRTFQVLPLPPAIGAVATINRARRVKVTVTCNEPPGDPCAGTVVVLTRRKFQPLAGGPVGRLTVMFAYVTIPGGQTTTVTRTVLGRVANVLRRTATVPVTISATLHPRTGQTIHATVRRRLRRVNR